eukprot:CAMPEP_0119378664 /NCGR_PEP_ID=MMETSP1334-20130426/49293_1 /TAXON_ID=127549 /ORGANISM="Calcidiscus leptoporus, Strain RCC1130" /LENGTH=359 /DNA_ID=CAMNT_0007397947 /DNA_START=6 /DNA_END=1085 /DNA_ORIENTATION=-
MSCPSLDEAGAGRVKLEEAGAGRDARCIKSKGHTGFGKHKEAKRQGVRGSADTKPSCGGGREQRARATEQRARVNAFAELGQHRERREREREREERGLLDDGGDGDGDEDAADGYDVDERKAHGAREDSAAEGEEGEDEAEEVGSGGEEEDWKPGPPFSELSDLEKIRLPRQRLEQWQTEPYFESVVRGCLVRIGLDQMGKKMYRVAEVVAVEERQQSYKLGARVTCKQLLLDFGEARLAYPMSFVSNGRFEELELLSWSQVLEVSDKAPVSQAQVAAKCHALEEAANYQYSEADVARMVQERRSAQAAPTMTTRMKMMQNQGASTRHDSTGGAADLAARPLKFQRNVLGQAIVQHEGK